MRENFAFLKNFTGRHGSWGGPADRVPAAHQAAGGVCGAEAPGLTQGFVPTAFETAAAGSDRFLRSSGLAELCGG
jgi:hypothetical protein